MFIYVKPNYCHILPFKIFYTVFIDNYYVIIFLLKQYNYQISLRIPNKRTKGETGTKNKSTAGMQTKGFELRLSSDKCGLDTH